MYFAKDEIIELNDNKKYLVIDTTIVDDIVYYKIKEILNNILIGDFIYVTTINKDSKIYINDRLTSEELERVKEKFEN